LGRPSFLLLFSLMFYYIIFTHYRKIKSVEKSQNGGNDEY